MCVRPVSFFRRKIPFFRRKSFPCRFCGWTPSGFKQNLEGVARRQTQRVCRPSQRLDCRGTNQDLSRGTSWQGSLLPRPHQFKFVIVLPQRGHRLLVLAQVVPQLLHWLSREGRTGFTGPQL